MQTEKEKSNVGRGYITAAGRVLALCLVCGAAVSATTGCSQDTQGEAPVVRIDHSGTDNPFVMTEVTVGDVLKTESVRFSFRQSRQEVVTFDVDGKGVEDVYVDIGDKVEAGQLLGVLEGGDRDEEIRDLEYKIHRNSLLLEHAQINEENELSARWWRYVYQSSGSDAETEKLNTDLDSIRQKYRYQKEDLQDEIDMDTAQIDTYKQGMEALRLYASVDGVITNMMDWRSTTSSKGAMAFRITDFDSCLFETTRTELAEYFPEGAVFEMVLGTGNNTVVYEVTPVRREGQDNKIFLATVAEDVSQNIGIGASGTITLVLDKRENVLAIPKGAVQTVEGKTCVYVLDENNVRGIKWVETGLYGDTLVEILSGLEEGEVIVLR